MPRDSNGNYTLPAGNPVVSGTVVSSSWANTTMTDVATVLTASLDRSGNGGMLVSFKLTDGTAAAPGLSFTSEPTTGLYRVGAGQMGVSVGGSLVMQWSAAGLATLGQNVTFAAPPSGDTVKATTVGTGSAYVAAMAGSGSALNITVPAATAVNLLRAIQGSGNPWAQQITAGGTLEFLFNNVPLLTISQAGAAVHSASAGHALTSVSVGGSGANAARLVAPIGAAPAGLDVGEIVSIVNSSLSGDQRILAFGQVGASTFLRVFDRAGVINAFSIEIANVPVVVFGSNGTTEFKSPNGSSAAITVIIDPATSGEPSLVVQGGSGVHSTKIADTAGNAFNAGYLETPFFHQTGYTCVLSDSGKTISVDASNVAIPQNSAVPYTLGTVLTFVNTSGSVQQILCNDTVILAGVGSTGARNLANNGLATAIKVGSTVWLISGAGLT